MKREADRHSSADRWIVCAQGHEHWGAAGAAGLLMLTDSPTGTQVLLQHRAPWVHNGDTWGIPSGALRHGEPVETGARREAAEEFEIPREAFASLPTLGIAVDDHGDWAFNTVAVTVAWAKAGRFAPTHGASASPRATVDLWSEVGTGGTRWLDAAALRDDTYALPLHPGFRASLTTGLLDEFLG